MAITLEIDRPLGTFTVEAEWLSGQLAIDHADREFDYVVYDQDGKEVAASDYGYLLNGGEYEMLLHRLYAEV